MSLIFEFDLEYCGFGIDWRKYVRGIRLGYVAVHVMGANDFSKIMNNFLLDDELANPKRRG